MARTPVTTRVVEILAASGRTDAECIIGFTYRALAARVYDTQDPTAVQLSAVRRAVARLMAAGRAERRGERLHIPAPWAEDLPTRRHHERRGKYGTSHVYTNPGGVVIFRTPTQEDHEAREAWLQTKGFDHLRKAAQIIERKR